MQELVNYLHLRELAFEQIALLLLAAVCGLIALQEFAAGKLAERRRQEAVRPGGSAYAETERGAPWRTVTWFPAFDRTGWLVI